MAVDYKDYLEEVAKLMADLSYLHKELEDRTLYHSSSTVARAVGYIAMLQEEMERRDVKNRALRQALLVARVELIGVAAHYVSPLAEAKCRAAAKAIKEVLDE